jgi:hypothetical protein
VREWLASLGRLEVAGAAFDTRRQGLPAFTGRASKCIRRHLARHGARIAASPESFLAGGLTGALAEGGLGRARAREERLSGVTASEAPSDLLTPFAVKSAKAREHRGAVSGPGDCSRRS